jgi:PilZ domain
MVISALDAGQSTSPFNRRLSNRCEYRVRARLRLFSDPEGTEPWTLYTRDVDAGGVGFITRHRLPLGYGGRIEFLAPNGEVLTATCTLLRCRPAAPGWYEGALYFNRKQSVLAE